MSDAAVGADPPLLLEHLRHVTERTARAAAAALVGGGRERGVTTIIAAMRGALDRVPFQGIVVTGERGAADGIGLGRGERVGSHRGSVSYDVALDPLEGTTYLAAGQTNAMAVIAVAPRGAMLDPGPCHYMEKLAVPAVARDELDPAWPTERKLRRLAEVLGKPVAGLTVFVLEKPRHNRLIAEIVAAGARVALYPAGDVAGAVAAVLDDGPIDALMGTGGTTEGMISACAARALGGAFWGRLDPQLATERAQVREACLSTEDWHPVEALVRSAENLFCATGITSGLLFEGVGPARGGQRTQTLTISGITGERQLLTSWLPTHPIGREP